MGKFGDYVGTIKQQTDSLREAVSAKSGVDCSKMSIGECGAIVSDLREDVYTKHYARPSWYPDIDLIAENAQIITIDSKKYYPVAVLLFENASTTSFKTAGSSFNKDYAVQSPNLVAIACSDMCGDVSNINADNLVIGSEYTHTWSKCIYSPNGEAYVTWAIVYSGSDRQQYAYFNLGVDNNVVEIVLLRGEYSSMFSQTTYCTKLKYLHCTAAMTPASTTAQLPVLEKFVVKKGTAYGGHPRVIEFVTGSGVTINGSSNYAMLSFAPTQPFNIYPNSLSLYNAKYIDLTHLVQVSTGGYGRIDSATVETLILPALDSYSSDGFFGTAYYLKRVKIPNTLKVWTTSASSFKYTEYIELFEDFDISGCTFTGNILKTKQWLKDLCKWLKDRTGEEANTLVIGTYNLNNASNIYLTFNPNDKRDITFDGITADTEGAISITEFITTQLNWTLS